MKNLLFRIFTVLGAASIFMLVFLSFRAPGSPPNNQGGDIFKASVSEVIGAPKEDRILVEAKDGTGVWVNNFYKNSLGYSPEKDALLVMKNADYSLRYYRTDGSFELFLDPKGSGSQRTRAEESLVGSLDIGKPDICRLKVSVSEFNSHGDIESSLISFCGTAFK